MFMSTGVVDVSEREAGADMMVDDEGRVKIIEVVRHILCKTRAGFRTRGGSGNELKWRDPYSHLNIFEPAQRHPEHGRVKHTPSLPEWD